MSIEVGKTAKFKGYTELEPGQDEILIAGEVLNVVEYDAEGQAYTVTAVEDPERADTIFVEEMEEIVVAAPAKSRRRGAAAPAVAVTEEIPPAEAAAPAAPAAPAKGGRKAKAAAAPAAAPAAEPAKAAKAEKPAAPVKPATKLIVIDTIQDMVGSHETALESAKSISGRLNEIREQEEEALFSLGGLLAYINEEQAFKSLGYEDLASYSEAELGFKKRRAEYYIRLYTELTGAGVSMKDIEGIGWTKLRALLGVIDKSNKKELLSKAKKMSRDDLADHMKEVKSSVNKASPSSEAPEFVKFPAFRLFKDQAVAFEAVIKAAQTQYNVDNMAEALFYLATDWQIAQDGDVPVEDALAALNARYGTTYGQEDADEVADEEDATVAA